GTHKGKFINEPSQNRQRNKNIQTVQPRTFCNSFYSLKGININQNINDNKNEPTHRVERIFKDSMFQKTETQLHFILTVLVSFQNIFLKCEKPYPYSFSSILFSVFPKRRILPIN